MTPQQWLESSFPNCKALNENGTFERYDYPENVRQWIRDNWIKVNDENGGTWEEPEYHRKKLADAKRHAQAQAQAQQWLESNFPNCKELDENGTFERYDYPENVRQWIRDNWIKVNDENGGIWEEPEYHRKKLADAERKAQLLEDWLNAIEPHYVASYGRRGDHY